MNTITQLVTCLLLSCKLVAELPPSHPLVQPNAQVGDQPRSFVPSGWISIDKVMGYILKSEGEANAARRLLEASGYGPKGTHYLFCTSGKAVADGKVFENSKSAVDYLVAKKVAVALYVSESEAFPKQIPAELTYSGLGLRALDCHK